jgi:transposase
MAKQLVDDELWEVIKPLLPPPPKRESTRGRPRLSDRAALTGILFVLRSGLPWEMLPQEMGCGSGMTCWRRLRDWHRAGVWRKLHRLLLSRLEQAGQLDWSRASIDSVSVRAKGAPRKKGAPSARAQRIAVNRARNAIRW